MAWATESSGETKRARHDLARREPAADRIRQRVDNRRARLVERPPEGRRRRLGVAPASERASDDGSIQFRDTRAHDAEDAFVHLDEAHERATIRQVDDLVGEVGDAVHVLGPLERGDENLVSTGLVRLEPRKESVEQRALALGERSVQVLRDHLLASPVPHAPGERLGVADGRPRIAERARVLVDAEREGRRLDRAHLDLPFGQDRHHGGREGAVLGTHGVLLPYPVELAGVVVEEDDLDLGAPGSRLEVAQAFRMRRLDDDQPLDRRGIDAAGLGDVQLFGMKAVEVPHVSVQRAGQGDDGPRIEAPRGQHGRERVEIGVRVGDDDLHGTKVSPALRQPPLWGT
jgi:hypothetical protein